MPITQWGYSPSNDIRLSLTYRHPTVGTYMMFGVLLLEGKVKDHACSPAPTVSVLLEILAVFITSGCVRKCSSASVNATMDESICNTYSVCVVGLPCIPSNDGSGFLVGTLLKRVIPGSCSPSSGSIGAYIPWYGLVRSAV